jgi:hypothetical protein
LITKLDGSLCGFGGELVEIDQSALARDTRGPTLCMDYMPIASATDLPSSAAAIVMVQLDI